MSHSLFNKILRNHYPGLDWIQVDVSTKCNADCNYCPHSVYRSIWQNTFLPIDYFMKLTPAMRRTGLVHLQGWGEPFTHPEIIRMIRIAKKQGCMVSTTTNGMLLNNKYINSIVEEGLDFIAFSLAGIDKKNDRIRRGTQFHKVIDVIKAIQNTKARMQSKLPKVHIAYMLLISGIDDLEKLPEIFGNLGVNMIVISGLTLITRPELEAESLYSMELSHFKELTYKLSEIHKKMKDNGTELKFHIPRPDVNLIYCPENIQKSALVTADGRVCPCVMTEIPVLGECFHYVQGKPRSLGNISFGNIFETPFNEIWRLKRYRKFRNSYLNNDICNNCLKRKVDEIVIDDPQEFNNFIPDLNSTV